MADENLKLENAHKRFRSVLTLNILVSAINNKGYPLLKWKTHAPNKKWRSNHLNHILAILVHNWHVIAAVAHNPQDPTPKSNPPNGGSSEREPYQVNIMQNLPRGPASGIGQDHENRVPPASVTAVANPDKSDPYFDLDPNAECVVVKSGISQFSRIFSSNIWESVLALE